MMKNTCSNGMIDLLLLIPEDKISCFDLPGAVASIQF